MPEPELQQKPEVSKGGSVPEEGHGDYLVQHTPLFIELFKGMLDAQLSRSRSTQTTPGP